MKVHAYASLPHYLEHALAVHRCLPTGLRGSVIGHVHQMRQLAEDDIVLVASFTDIAATSGRRTIYIEHGAGQSYVGIPDKSVGYYHGADHPENVIGYICPRQQVADSWDRPAIAVGSPVCDPYGLHSKNFLDKPVAAITFHWNGERVCPEAGTALEHYVHDLGFLVRALRRQGFHVLGHNHPRDKRLPTIWRNLQVETASVRTVREEADLLIADNTSLMYEMAHLNRMVLALNAPWYRRDVEHGLRFWDAVPGPQVDDPGELSQIDFRQLVTPNGDPEAERLRTAASVAAYGAPLSDGGAGFRAAAWVTALAYEK